MPSKYTQRNFQKSYFYHIYNRGGQGQKIFFDHKDYKTFTDILSYYLTYPRGKPLSQIHRKNYQHPNVKGRTLDIEAPTYQLVCYCLMPTHPHLLIKQSDSPSATNNISDFMKRLTVTYTLYFNQRHGLSGSLYQGKFRNVRIKTDEQLLYLSKYIHLNPKSPLKHLYSSLSTFIGQSPTPKWLHPEEILELNYYKNSKNPQKDYQNFVLDSKPMPKSISSLTLE